MKARRLASLLMCFGAPCLSQPAPLLEESVRKLAAARVAAGAYPSLVIGVARGSRQEILAYGSIADDPKSKPNGDTVYEIGSVTKTFTALLLADAVQRGDVTLEQPVQGLLPGYTIPKSGERAITLLDLATQSSGLPRLPENLLPKDPANPYAGYTPQDMKRFLAGYRLPRAPGERYEYSNLGFGLLGKALAERSGASYEELIRTRIATPLGLNDTAIALSPRMAERLAKGHDAAAKPAGLWDLGAIEGAGALRSTGHDLLAYVRAHMHPPSGPLFKALAAVARPQRSTDNERVKIGLAWHVESRQGREIVWHNGMTGGYSAFVGFTADGERGVVVLTNVARDAGEIAFAALLPEAMATSQTKETTLLPQASAPDEFFYKVVDAQLSFQRAADGSVSSVVLPQNGRDLRGARQSE